MNMVSFEGINETDSNGWVNFSKPNDETRSRSSNLQKQSDLNSSPPRLSLPLEHYCMIAEKVFISFLRSYRSLYINDSVPSREKVTMLGKRLQTFLSVVLPSHSGFALVEHDKESRRIKDMTSMLREYLDKVQERDTSANQDSPKERRDDCESRLKLKNIGNNEEGRTFPESLESSSFCGSDSSIFGDINSASEDINDDDGLKAAVSKEHNSSSSEMLALKGSSETVQVFENGEQYEIIHKCASGKDVSSDDISCCFTETSGFDASIIWDASSLSVHGQIGEFYSHECSDTSVCLPDIERATTSDTSDISVDFSAGDASWKTNDSNPCETNFRFESLMNHWKDKEKGWSDKRRNEERSSAH